MYLLMYETKIKNLLVNFSSIASLCALSSFTIIVNNTNQMEQTSHTRTQHTKQK
jgi:hypothetical protein